MATAPTRPIIGDHRSAAALGMVAGGLLVAMFVGTWYGHPGWLVEAAPFFGRWEGVAPWRLLPAGAGAAAVVMGGPVVARRFRWPALLLTVVAVAAAWAGALVVVDGFTGPNANAAIAGRDDYVSYVAEIDSLGPFLSTFTDDLTFEPIHIQAHPPGFVTVLWLLDRAGLGGTGPATTLIVAGWASTGAAVLLTVRHLAGEATARRLAPFVVLLPAAIWSVSADGFFTAVVAWGIALVVLATGRDGWPSSALAALGGLTFGAAIFLTYGAAPLVLVPVAIAVARRRLDVLAIAAAGGAMVVAAFAAGGFWWFDGLAETRARYGDGVANIRPYAYFVWANLVVLAVSVGPAAVAGMARLRRGPTGLLVGAAIGAVLLADLSGLSKAEVERIWLPFVPWVAVAAAGLVVGIGGRRSLRPWLAANAVTALVLQLALRSPW